MSQQFKTNSTLVNISQNSEKYEEVFSKYKTPPPLPFIWNSRGAKKRKDVSSTNPKSSCELLFLDIRGSLFDPNFLPRRDSINNETSMSISFHSIYFR